MVDNVTYLLLTLAVHACTCSALTSALLYREVNCMEIDTVPIWAQDNWMMLLMPMGKFAMGCSSYIISVVFATWSRLAVVPTSRNAKAGTKRGLLPSARC